MEKRGKDEICNRDHENPTMNWNGVFFCLVFLRSRITGFYLIFFHLCPHCTVFVLAFSMGWYHDYCHLRIVTINIFYAMVNGTIGRHFKFNIYKVFDS